MKLGKESAELTLDSKDDALQLGPRPSAHQRIRVLHNMREPFLKHRDGPLVGIKLGRVGDFLGAERAGLNNVEVRGVAVGGPEPEGVAIRERNQQLEAWWRGWACEQTQG